MQIAIFLDGSHNQVLFWIQQSSFCLHVQTIEKSTNFYSDVYGSQMLFFMLVYSF